MGLSGSQAKLLLITARLADNELRSQTINNAKMRLATQSAQASDNYINALNEANLMFGNYTSDGTYQSQLLTYNSLMAYSSYNNQYGLVNSAGQLLVSESEADIFESANGNLNAYLKKHGLEYTTTYFDKLGNIENPDYPAPFKTIEAGTLKEWYEAYGSYENSIEVEDYEKLYNAYSDASSELNAACRPTLSEFFKSTSNTPDLIVNGGDIKLDGMPGDLGGMMDYFKNAFMNPNNTYSIEYLKNCGFITDEAYEAVKKELDAFSKETYQVTGPGGITMNRTGVKVTNDAGFYLSKDDASTGNKTYTVDGEVQIEVDSSGKVVNVTVPPVVDVDDPEYNFKNSDGSVYDWSGKTLDEVLNKLVCDQYSDVGGTRTYCNSETYSASRDSNGDIVLKSSTLYTDSTQLTDVINSVVKSIYNFLLSDENFNYANFAQALANNEASVSGKVTVPPELQAVINTYESAKTAYLEYIFGENTAATNDSFDIVNQLLRDGKVTGRQLQDVDFVLKLMNGSITDTAGNPLVTGGLTISDSYLTVVKQFVIENMIANTGEPEYAWIDENDKSNTGNADAKAQWYTNLFNRMKQGYKVLENGLASSSEWIEFALESGLVHMEQVDKSFNWKSLDYKTCSAITEETSSEASTKAEAEYNRAMKDIDAKDSLYDMQLKNLDTEHSALQTEYDSLKSVMSKNIDRTFKFNQNG